MDHQIKFAFFGTPDVAQNTLEILKRAGFLPSVIITSPDARGGRGMRVKESPTATFAKENKIPCLKPEKLDKESALQLNVFDLKLFVVVAYGKIIPEQFLNLPKYGAINIHYSLLPKYRGASPVETVILNGETETGVTIQKIVPTLDAGPILAQEKTAIGPDETAPELRKRLIKLGGEMLVKFLNDFPLTNENLGGVDQDHTQATYAQKIKKTDGLIDLVTESPRELYNKFRAYAGWPRVFFFKDGKRIIITKARLENQQFIIEKILPEGKREIIYKP